ncbi:hypothetical protein EJ03DRAFT_329351 [Teratosphaeria nubilosa]|uniref:FZ domain-containing protein n=1 Tax=Teratosphaeria nubilosa TaxID=161662 RepID=A0A6G1L3C6_9PEZI|nr:hypothetical protein EJ03DRAFT_329351 [Teratosphaeria nubilosa]
MAGNVTLWEYPNALLMANYTTPGAGLPSDPEENSSVERHHAELRKRQSSSDTRNIFVSINTCLQPTWNGTGTQTDAPPQLTLYVGTTANNSDVGPDGSNDTQTLQELQAGFASVTVPASGTWYIAVSAPALPDGFVGVWNYELAVSIDDYYHQADSDTAFLYLVDTDMDSALLVTDNLTLSDPSSTVFKQWMNLTDPFIIFAANVNHTVTKGIENSYCGWKQYAQIQANQADPEGITTGVQMGMITRGLGNKPKEQFYLTGLNGSSDYTGVLAMVGNSTASGSGVVGGGGKVWAPVPWTTKNDGNCQLMFNLSFCDEVAYAVPANPNKYNITGMREQFDNYTQFWYNNFNMSLQQIACNTTPSAQYSLTKNCSDCYAAYKEWFCAVSIPRCEDFSNTAEYLQIRNVGQPHYNNNTMLPDSFLNTPYKPMTNAPTLPGSPWDTQTYISSLATNSSRNALIDTQIQPGPYKEVLPCQDLCYSLVQSCPAALGFNCPYPGRGLEAGYGKRSPDGTVTCSYMGAYYSFNGGSSFRVSGAWLRAVVVAGLVALSGGFA